MRIGAIEVHWLRRHPVSGLRELPWGALRQDLSPAARQAVARVARSEVKNYLAELAEDSEIPFGNPAGFLRNLKNIMDFATGDAKHKPHCQFPNCTDADHPVCGIPCDRHP